MTITNPKVTRLFALLAIVFVGNALLAEFIGVKIFALEPTLGLKSLELSLFDFKSTLNFTAGVIIWPIVFVLTDILNEYYGHKGVRFISILAALFIAYAFGVMYLAIHVIPADFWVSSNKANGVPDMQAAYKSILGQGQRIIVGSLTAFLIGQLIDAMIFRKVKKITGEKHLYLRATVSTFFSQLIDSYVVLYIAFVYGLPQGQAWSLNMFWAIGTINFVYKLSAAILLIPLIYIAHIGIEKYLGEEVASRLKKEALQE
jgi:uncharacterized integral membrane protein (TIGR00697 family)